MTPPEQPTPEALTVEILWRDLCEKDDRTSPEEYPDHALITFDELKYCCESVAAQRAAEAVEMPPRPETHEAYDEHLLRDAQERDKELIGATTPLPGDAREQPANVELLDAIIAYYISRSWPSYQATDWFRDMQFTKAMLEEQSAAIKRHGLRRRGQS